MSATTETTGTEPAGGCPVHYGYEPFSQGDPFESYEALRREEPVFLDERTGYWVVSRYADVKDVFRQWETFSSENAQKPVRPRGPQATRIMNEGGFTAYSGLSARVPPDHTRIRKIASKAFTPRRYKALEPTIRAHVDRLLTTLLARSERSGDAVLDIANDVPTITILTLVGADVERQVLDYKRWSDSRAAMTWSDLSDEEQVPHAHNLVEYWTECQRLVADAHAKHPDSLIGDLVRSQESGEEITDHEIASVCYSLLFAEHETTTTLIANTLRVLLEHRDQWDTVVEDPSLIPGAIDEVLRYSPSITAWRRMALVDTNVGGIDIAAGDELLLLMGSANRDEEVFADPTSVDVGRANPRDHLAFGFGIHYCLGNMLAKLQTRIVVEEVARSAPFLEVDPNGVAFSDSISLRAPTSVPLSWSAA